MTLGGGLVPGMYYRKSLSSGKSRTGTSSTPEPTGGFEPIKPSIFASRGEKNLYKALVKKDMRQIRNLGDEFPEFRIAAYSLAGFGLVGASSEESKQLLRTVFDNGAAPEQDPFMKKYVAAEVAITIAEGVQAAMPVTRDAVGLLLAELEQEEGNLGEAIAVVEQLEPTSVAALSLAELYSLREGWNEAIELTEGVANEDEVTALLLVYRGRAFRKSGFHEAAHETLKQALRFRSRQNQILNLARIERGKNFLDQGKKSQARKDFERVLAEDSNYDGLAALLAESAA